jgi:hypothetical protein
VDIMLGYSEACPNIGWATVCDAKPKMRLALLTLLVEKFSVLEIVSRFRNRPN